MQASRWSYSSDVAISHDKKTRATVVQRYHFSSNLRRMSATILLEEEDDVQAKPVAVMKGAPEVIRQHLRTVSCIRACLWQKSSILLQRFVVSGGDSVMQLNRVVNGHVCLAALQQHA